MIVERGIGAAGLRCAELLQALMKPARGEVSGGLPNKRTMNAGRPGPRLCRVIKRMSLQAENYRRDCPAGNIWTLASVEQITGSVSPCYSIASLVGRDLDRDSE